MSKQITFKHVIFGGSLFGCAYMLYKTGGYKNYIFPVFKKGFFYLKSLSTLFEKFAQQVEQKNSSFANNVNISPN